MNFANYYPVTITLGRRRDSWEWAILAALDTLGRHQLFWLWIQAGFGDKICHGCPDRWTSAEERWNVFSINSAWFFGLLTPTAMVSCWIIFKSFGLGAVMLWMPQNALQPAVWFNVCRKSFSDYHRLKRWQLYFCTLSEPREAVGACSELVSGCRKLKVEHDRIAGRFLGIGIGKFTYTQWAVLP